MICVTPPGGLTAALKPTMAAVGGTWIAQASGSADRETCSPEGRLRVPPEAPRFSLRRLWIPSDLREGHYEGLSNRALWPLCHNVYQRPVFCERDWLAYRRVNELFAEAVLEESQGGPAFVFIQDYHFGLLPRLLSARNPALTVGQFWHIPFPNPDIALTFPWIDELIEGMSGNDLLAFHLPQHVRNFIDTVDRCRGVRANTSSRSCPHDRSTAVRSFPISIDFAQHTSDAASSAVEASMQAWRERLGDVEMIGLGIDRLDYTKGIPERLRALATIFQTNPSVRGKLTFVQVGVPTRNTIAEYSRLQNDIETEVRSINQTWGCESWTPVIFEKRNLPPAEMMALHRLAHFCMVTPLHDGMNLVAKEFVASRHDCDGVLILSRFAGAAQELKTALLVNPFSERDLCDAIERAIRMPESERHTRMKIARMVVEANDIYKWAGELLRGMAVLADDRKRPLRPMRLAEALSVGVA